jgi:hypothetical protein
VLYGNYGWAVSPPSALFGNILSGHEAIDWDCACLRVGSLFRSTLLRLRFGRVALAATLRGSWL